MLRVISLGAGVQSTTMALMAAHGEIGPMPHCAIFADTQAEPQSVYEHLRWLMSPNVLPFPVHVVTRGNLAKDGQMTRISKKSGKRYLKTLIPLFIQNPDGSKGILNRKCTSEYKIRELTKKVRQLVGKRPRDEISAEQWIGISVDEAWRMKPSRETWIKHRWPLIEKDMSRAGCLRWMKAHGYPRPPRSACVFCPYHSDMEWRRLRNEEPKEFSAAVQWEKEMQEKSKECEVIKGKPFLHSSLKPLDQVDLRTDEEAGQPDLFLNECEGMCGV